ncbi:MAG: hypothetical protein Q7J35_19250 [Candidatus Methanoperedens sp.]|nr:hypothetical protein [Candidatus Methanoperedens sp.]
MKPVKIVVEKHEGYVAYPLGLNGVVIGQGGIDKAGILSQIRQEWYCISPPSEPYNVKEMFEAEISARCEKAGSPITKEAAHIYVSNAFRDWKWGVI